MEIHTYTSWVTTYNRKNLQPIERLTYIGGKCGSMTARHVLPMVAWKNIFVQFIMMVDE